MRRNKYVTDDDYVQADYVIYNDLDKSLLPGFTQVLDVTDEEFVQAVLKEGEQWVDLSPLGYSGYIVTSYGRTLNTIRKKAIKVRNTTNTVHLYIQGTYVNIEDIFQQQNWEFDTKLIKRYFDKYNWRYYEYTN